MLWKVFQHSTCMSTYYQKYFWNSTCMSTYYQKYSNIDCVCQQTIEGISTYRKYVKILSKVFWHSVSMSKDNQKYVKTLAKVCRKKKYVTALKSMSTTSKSMSQHTEYVKSSPIFLMRQGEARSAADQATTLDDYPRDAPRWDEDVVLQIEGRDAAAAQSRDARWQGRASGAMG